MASGPSDENVEQTKRQIRDLVNQVTEMAKSDVDASEFYPSVLQRVVSACVSTTCATWPGANARGMAAVPLTLWSRPSCPDLLPEHPAIVRLTVSNAAH